MLIIRGTKKLRDRAKKAPKAEPSDTSTTELGDWFATAMFWQPQVVLLVNTRTFLPVLMPLAPAATLLDRAPQAIADVLRLHGVPDADIERELEAMSEVRLAPTNDRQVLGVMNEFVFQAERWRSVGEQDLLDLSGQLSRVILGPLMKRGGRPIDELQDVFAPGAEIIPFPGNAPPSAEAPAERASIHQLKVTLRSIKPPIWRRVVVDGAESLHHLHAVIQAAFGWYNCHLHQFEIDGAYYSIPSPEDWEPVIDERQHSIDDALKARKIRYDYDFGDGWEHDVILEKTFPIGFAEAPATVPDCIEGRRACPPEDCGGPWGYAELLEILEDPAHPEHAERLEWVGRPFDANAFDPSDVAHNLSLTLTPLFDDEAW